MEKLKAHNSKVSCKDERDHPNKALIQFLAHEKYSIKVAIVYT